MLLVPRPKLGLSTTDGTPKEFDIMYLTNITYILS